MIPVAVSLLRWCHWVAGFFEGSVIQKNCTGFVWQGFGSRGSYRSGFSEKVLEASPVSGRGNAWWFHDGPATGQG